MIPKFSRKVIEIVTEHEMPICMFFQSKIFNIPCKEFSLHVNFERKDVLPQNQDFIFRWTLFESKYNNHRKVYAKSSQINEGYSKELHLSSKWMKPGDGYALTIGLIDTDYRKDQMVGCEYVFDCSLDN